MCFYDQWPLVQYTIGEIGNLYPLGEMRTCVCLLSAHGGFLFGLY